MALPIDRKNLQSPRGNELKPRKLLVLEKEGKEHSFITDLRKCRLHRMSVKKLCENVFQEKKMLSKRKNVIIKEVWGIKQVNIYIWV